MVKQVFDLHGPLSGFRWQQTSPPRLFDIWPGNATLGEMSCLLQADWYVITDPVGNSRHIRTILNNPALVEVVRKHVKNVSTWRDIPFNQYDIVITLDPILQVPETSQTVFAYFVMESSDPLYLQSLLKPVGNYDLFLAHMLDADPEVERIPQPLSFPYLYSSEVPRSVIGIQEKEESIWAECHLL
ncbi:MAG: hypothetical protein EXR62_16725 [Chloroflexi bacterium]|nr:hypothetical protein [Chloroflexota bacterium]